MPIMYERCAGLDVHKKIVVAWVLTPDRQGGWSQEIRTFGTMTSARPGRATLLTDHPRASRPRRRAHERDLSQRATPASGGKARQQACDCSRGSLDAGDGL